MDDLLDVAAPHIDGVKLGWGTAAVTRDLARKIAVLRAHGVGFHFGGTLLEAYLLRDELDAFRRLLDRYRPALVEVSDGVVRFRPGRKQRLIRDLARDHRVLAEVGRKNPAGRMNARAWIAAVQADLHAGAWKVVCEARENGRAGICTPAGRLREQLVEQMIRRVPPERLVFEAPAAPAQAWLVRRFGPDVNLANIHPFDVLALETLRRGLRADTLTAWTRARSSEWLVPS